MIRKEKILTASDLWKDDQVQFCRLLAEIGMVGLTKKQIGQLKESADLTEEEIRELFDRAFNEFEKIKKKVCHINCTNRNSGI